MRKPKNTQAASAGTNQNGQSEDAKSASGTADQDGVMPVIFVVKKNHGLVHNGRASEFFEAGTELDSVADAALISKLSISGAILEQQ